MLTIDVQKAINTQKLGSDFFPPSLPLCSAVPHMARQCTALQCQCIHEESSRSLRSNQSNVDYRGGSVTDAFINVPSSSAQGYLVIKWYSLQIDMKNDISFKSGAHVQVSSDLLRYIYESYYYTDLSHSHNGQHLICSSLSSMQSVQQVLRQIVGELLVWHLVIKQVASQHIVAIHIF